MGVHTGDSITVARRKRLRPEYQVMRDAADAVIARSESRPEGRTSSSASILRRDAWL